jgi:2-polyprenyl-6-methoxyphenol hydroxylase-like FAD-dependent oxidoreductase
LIEQCSHEIFLQPNAVGFGQDLLEAVLSKALFDRFGVKIEHMKELTSFKSMKDKVIAQLIATNLDGTASTETAEAKYLVGTDGGRSKVRKELGFAFEGETLGGALILGDIQMNGIDHKVCVIQIHTNITLKLALRFLTLGMLMASDGTFRSLTLGDHILTHVIHRIVLIPASQRPGHPLALRMMLPMKADEHFDPDAFIKDRDAVRRRIEDIIERKDITAGEFTYLAVYRFAYCASGLQMC